MVIQISSDISWSNSKTKCDFAIEVAFGSCSFIEQSPDSLSTARVFAVCNYPNAILVKGICMIDAQMPDMHFASWLMRCMRDSDRIARRLMVAHLRPRWQLFSPPLPVSLLRSFPSADSGAWGPLVLTDADGAFRGRHRLPPRYSARRGGPDSSEGVQRLTDLHTHVSGINWGRLARVIAASSRFLMLRYKEREKMIFDFVLVDFRRLDHTEYGFRWRHHNDSQR